MKNLIFLIVIWPFNVKSQSIGDTLINPSQQWIIYLDSNWQIVTDTSTQVSFTCKTYFVEEKIFHLVNKYGGKNFKLQKAESNSPAKTPELLSGKYFWYDGNGKLFSEHLFENGELLYSKEYDKKGRLRQYYDFTKKWKAQALSYCVYQYNKKGDKLSVFWFCIDENGHWPKWR